MNTTDETDVRCLSGIPVVVYVVAKNGSLLQRMMTIDHSELVISDY